jgi:hypothetical protein
MSRAARRGYRGRAPADATPFPAGRCRARRRSRCRGRASPIRAASSWLGPVCSLKAHWLMPSASRAVSVGVTSFSKSSMTPRDRAESSVRSSALRSLCPDRRLSSAFVGPVEKDAARRRQRHRPPGIVQKLGPQRRGEVLHLLRHGRRRQAKFVGRGRHGSRSGERLEDLEPPQRHTFRQRGGHQAALSAIRRREGLGHGHDRHDGRAVVGVNAMQWPAARTRSRGPESGARCRGSCRPGGRRPAPPRSSCARRARSSGRSAVPGTVVSRRRRRAARRSPIARKAPARNVSPMPMATIWRSASSDVPSYSRDSWAPVSLQSAEI